MMNKRYTNEIPTKKRNGNNETEYETVPVINSDTIRNISAVTASIDPIRVLIEYEYVSKL